MQRKSERFVICQNVKLPPLHVMPEVVHSQVARQQLPVKCRLLLLGPVLLLGVESQWLETATACSLLEDSTYVGI